MLTTRAVLSPAQTGGKRSLLLAAALAVTLAAAPGNAGSMGGGGGASPQHGGGQGGWAPHGGRGGHWDPPLRGGRSGYPGAGRWQNCHSFSAASRAAFRQGDYARGNALQDRFYDCMRSRWIR